ncbi:uncharacterized protein [Prorops nasuta]|uniref:uncharacterized protein n=1 Tax=Prorops nasuta TaxID=863751 RepID=UPI0034CEF8B8
MMLILYALLFFPVFGSMENLQTTKADHFGKLKTISSLSPSDRVSEGLLNIVDAFLPISKSFGDTEGRRRKHKLNKYVLPLIVGFLLIKSILLPIALKALAVLSGKAVVLSLMSLILAAIVGLKRVAQSSYGHNYDLVNLSAGKYRRKDVALDIADEGEDTEPYKYYRDRRRKK